MRHWLIKRRDLELIKARLSHEKNVKFGIERHVHSKLSIQLKELN